MSALATLYEMTPRRKDPSDDRIARALRARRSYLGKTQEELVDESGGLLNVRLISEMELGKRSVLTLTLPKLRAYLETLEWTGEDFSRETGVEVPTAVPIPGSTDYAPTLAVPRYGSVSAGINNNGEPDPDEEPYMLDPRLPWLRGRNLSRLAVMTVNGDSMVSQNAAQSVPHGSMVVVELGAAPADGELVVAWIDDLSVSVLKRFDEGGDTVLKSLNPRGPVFRAETHDIDIRGVVRFVITKP